MAGGEMAQVVIDEYAPKLQALLRDFGLPPRLAQTVRLQWTGATFEAFTANREVLQLEIGDGKRPPLAALRKAMNRMKPELDAVLRLRLEEGIDGLIEEGVLF